MTDGDMSRGKYVFVCGLHRSGTSILGRNIARFENCTGFKNTGATEDEGQFLQTIYPVAAKLGGPGRFGFDPRSHRTENSSLLTSENVCRLRASWHAHWGNGKDIFVEKTPANILMTRFLQAAFPNSYFVVIRRHPVAVSMATQNLWKKNLAPLHRLFEHWLHCHRLFDSDKPYLKRLYEVTYEDYVRDPVKYHDEIAAFVGTRILESQDDGKHRYVVRVADQPVSRVSDRAFEQLSVSHNEKYLRQWADFLSKSAFKRYYRYIASRYELRFKVYGYSLLDSLKGADEMDLQTPISNVIGLLCCLGADGYARLWRVASRTKQLVAGSTRRVTAKSPVASRGGSPNLIGDLR
jgi:hypothetical protein